jgi:hypothetical protein
MGRGSRRGSQKDVFERAKEETESKPEHSRPSWHKELSIALIAALAVLVSGAVSAFVSWQTSNNSLAWQSSAQAAEEESATKAYLRDARQKVYTDVLRATVDLADALAAIGRSAQLASAEGKPVPNSLFDAFVVSSDAYQTAVVPLHILGSTETQRAASVVASQLFVLAPEIGKFRWNQSKMPADSLRHNSDVLVYKIGKYSADSAPFTMDLLQRMRTDLGVPGNQFGLEQMQDVAAKLGDEFLPPDPGPAAAPPSSGPPR